MADNVLTREELAELELVRAELLRRREQRERARRLGRLGLGPTLPADNPLFQGGGLVMPSGRMVFGGEEEDNGEE